MTARLWEFADQRRAWLGLAVAVLTVFLLGLGSYRSLGTHEVVAAVPGREMWQSGDWVVPRFGEVPRLKKPPLVYWLIATSSWLCGETNELAARLHSAVAGIGLVGVMSLWARRWYCRDAAFAAAVVQAFSVWTLSFGRRAEIDMVLCLLTTSALFLIATQPEDESTWNRRWRWIGIWSLLGVSGLAKFHYGVAMVLAPTIVFWATQRQWRRFRDLFNPIGLVVAIGCVAIWPWLLLERFPEALEVWRRQTIGRATGELGADPWWIYPSGLAVLTLPWTLHIVTAMRSSWRAAWSRGDSRERFVWIWIGMNFLLLSLSPNRHHNYLASLLPAMTLLACQSAVRLQSWLRRPDVRVPRAVLIVGGVTLPVLIGVAFWRMGNRVPDLRNVVAVVAGVALVAVMAIIVFLHQRNWSRAGWTTLWVGVGMFGIAVLEVSPRWDHRVPTVEFARRVRQRVLHEHPVSVFVPAGVLPDQHPVVFYLNDPVRRVLSLDELAAGVTEQGSLLTVTEPRFVPEIARFASIRELDASSIANSKREVPLVCLELTPRRTAEIEQVGHQTN